MAKSVKCHSLAEIREQIDRLDAEIVPRLVERVEYIYQAAAIKGDASQVPALDRVERQIVAVRARTVELGGDPDFMERVYRTLITLYTEEEHRRLAQRQQR